MNRQTRGSNSVRSVRTSRAASRTADDDRGGSRWAVLQRLGWSHRDAVAFLVASATTVAILVNVLFMQSGPHPAPMFKSALIAAAPASVAPKPTSGVAQPRTRTAD